MKTDELFVGQSELGRGIFTKRLIRSGEIVLSFTGTLVRFEAVVAKGSASMNALQIGRGDYIDLEPPGVFVNHSCEPNTGVTSGLSLVALRDIEAYEEIFYDYSTVMSEKYETMQCMCGRPGCRKTIGDFDLLTPEVQTKYLSRGIVPSFIVGEIMTFDHGSG